MKLSKVAKAVNGTFVGDGEVEIHAMASLSPSWPTRSTPRR